MGVTEPGTLQFVADATGVGEPWLGHLTREVLTQRRLRILGQVIARPFQHQPPNGGELVQFVGGEIQVMRNARAHPGVRAEEFIHPLLVTRKDYHELIAVVFHYLKLDVDRFLAVIQGVPDPVEVISLVDEQDPAHRPVKHALGLRRRLPDVLADQVVAHGVHQLPLLQVAEPVQQLSHPQGDGSLPGARGPVKHMCRFGRGASSPNRCRARSTSSSAAISCTFFFTGTSPTRSLSRPANTSSMPAARRSAAKVTVASMGSGAARSRLRREVRRWAGAVRPLFLRPVHAVSWAAFPAGRKPRIASTTRPRKMTPATVVMIRLP